MPDIPATYFLQLIVVMVGVPLLGLLLGITLGLSLRPKDEGRSVPPMLPLSVVALAVILLLVLAADMLTPTPTGLFKIATTAALPGGLALAISLVITYSSAPTKGKS